MHIPPQFAGQAVIGLLHDIDLPHGTSLLLTSISELITVI